MQNETNKQSVKIIINSKRHKIVENITHSVAKKNDIQKNKNQILHNSDSTSNVV